MALDLQAYFLNCQHRPEATMTTAFGNAALTEWGIDA